MKRFQVEVKGEVGVWGEVEVFELMDLYQHQPRQELFEVHSGDADFAIHPHQVLFKGKCERQVSQDGDISSEEDYSNFHGSLV